LHSFGSCSNLHSHVFKTLLPSETLSDAEIPSSCQTCHHHKDADLKTLQQQFEILSQMPKPLGQTVQAIPAMPPKAKAQ